MISAEAAVIPAMCVGKAAAKAIDEYVMPQK